jgi:hypothetical protein
MFYGSARKGTETRGEFRCLIQAVRRSSVKHMGRPGLIFTLLVFAGCLVLVSIKYPLDPLCASEQNVVALMPPSGFALGSFSCLKSATAMRREKRRVVLHGPDWILESLVENSCFPERDVVFSAEVGNLLLHHPVVMRTRLWVMRSDDMFYVRIVEGSGDEKQDMIAVDLVTNHKCTGRHSQTCRVEGGSFPLLIDSGRRC